MPEEPLPKVIPLRPTAPIFEEPDPLPGLELAKGFRLCHRHKYELDGSETIYCCLQSGGDTGDSPQKTMFVLNGYVSRGYEIAGIIKGSMPPAEVMSILLVKAI